MSEGGKCWCSYQRDQVTGLNIYISTKASLPDAILDVFKLVFIRPVSVSFLEPCKNCSNQNASESFNSVVCSLSPKETFNSSMETSFAINLAVCLFNDGFEFTLRSALSAAGLSFTECSLQQWRNIDNERIENGDYVCRPITKQRIKERKILEIKKQKAFQHKEGAQYELGAFYNKFF